MQEFNKKRILRHRLYSVWVIVLVLTLAFFSVRAAWRATEKSHIASSNLKRLQNELEELRKQESALLTEIDKLDSEKGREEEIRKRFNVVKDGEEMVVVVWDDEANSAKGAPQKSGSFWNWLVNLFRLSD